jgi:hypothetical protein
MFHTGGSRAGLEHGTDFIFQRGESLHTLRVAQLGNWATGVREAV